MRSQITNLLVAHRPLTHPRTGYLRVLHSPSFWAVTLPGWIALMTFADEQVREGSMSERETWIFRQELRDV